MINTWNIYDPMSIGVDDLSFYTSSNFLPLSLLAEYYSVDKNKYRVGIGQDLMAVPAVDEDIVTMAANAAKPVVEQCDHDAITTVLFATESGIDQSKSAGIYLHALLALNPACRVVEIKQACYSATAALQFASALVARNPQQKVLVIASDIALYQQGSSGEATQGCGAVAMLITHNPRLIEIHPISGCYTEDVMDFWRPNYMETALVNGKFSTMVYLKALRYAWKDYLNKGGMPFSDIARFCYHLPFSKMGEKAHRKLALTCSANLSEMELHQQVAAGFTYNRKIGNSYTASLYIALASLLENDPEDLSALQLGLFSYGSGCMAEFFTATVCEGYQQHLRQTAHRQLLSQRHSLTYEEYEKRFYFSYPKESGNFEFPVMTNGHYRLSAVRNHQRIYTKNR